MPARYSVPSLSEPPLHLGRVIAARGRKKNSKVKSLLSRLLPYVQDRRCAWDCRVREVRTLSEQLRQHRQARRAISAKSTVVGAGLRARPHAFSCSMRARMRYSTASAPSLSLVACRGARGGLPPKVVLDRLMWEKSAMCVCVCFRPFQRRYEVGLRMCAPVGSPRDPSGPVGYADLQRRRAITYTPTCCWEGGR